MTLKNVIVSETNNSNCINCKYYDDDADDYANNDNNIKVSRSFLFINTRS